MDKADAQEAALIVQRALLWLLKLVPSSGRAGSDARTQISDTRAAAYELLRADALSTPLMASFDLTVAAGAKFEAIEEIVRKSISEETPVTLGATLIRGVLIGLCFAAEAELISNMTFVSRQDVDRIKNLIQGPFNDAEEAAADDMDQAAYMALIQLHAAIINFLVETGRPLPRMLNYQFSSIYPSLVLSYKLYDDAGRADEVRAENKIIHPAFCPQVGLALSN